jgi:hypothetical protein
MNAEIQVLILACIKLILLSQSSLAASADECARAAEVYKCGKNKAPTLTDAIQQQLMSDRSSPPAAVMLNYRIFFQ